MTMTDPEAVGTVLIALATIVSAFVLVAKPLLRLNSVITELEATLRHMEGVMAERGARLSELEAKEERIEDRVTDHEYRIKSLEGRRRPSRNRLSFSRGDEDGSRRATDAEDVSEPLRASSSIAGPSSSVLRAAIIQKRPGPRFRRNSCQRSVAYGRGRPGRSGAPLILAGCPIARAPYQDAVNRMTTNYNRFK